MAFHLVGKMRQNRVGLLLTCHLCFLLQDCVCGHERVCLGALVSRSHPRLRVGRSSSAAHRLAGLMFNRTARSGKLNPAEISRTISDNDKYIYIYKYAYST